MRSLKIVGNPKVEICSHLQTPHQRCLKSPVEPDRISEKGRNNAGSAVSDNRGASKTWDGGAGRSRNILPAENTQVIERSRRTTIEERTNCAQLERIWNAGFSRFALFFQPQTVGLVSRQWNACTLRRSESKFDRVGIRPCTAASRDNLESSIFALLDVN